MFRGEISVENYPIMNINDLISWDYSLCDK